jgi:hypothetical protein
VNNQGKGHIMLLESLPMTMPLVSTFLESSGFVHLTILEIGGRILYANPTLSKCLKVGCAEITGKNFMNFLTGPDGESLTGHLARADVFPDEELLLNLVDADQVPHSLRFRIAPLGECFLLLGEPPREENQSLQEELIQLNNQLSVLSRENIRKGRKLAQRALELEQTLSRVKLLEGIIPICMYCKQIRDDQDSWNQLEKYISEHSEAEFSHGICPACLDKHYGEYAAKPGTDNNNVL